MTRTSLLLAGLFASAVTGWRIEDSHTTASLRGLSVRAEEIWASGTSGTYLHSRDSGVTWHAGRVEGAGSLDFRAVAAIGPRIYLVSSGPGEQSRIYESENAGKSWKLQFSNAVPQGFFDAVALWDTKNGIVLGDPIDGRWDILTTSDGGKHWTRHLGPPSRTDEGAFAASGTCLIARGTKDAWFVTGGKGGARVLHSTDRGQTWTSVETPIRHDGPGAGIFSIAFKDDLNGIVVGGDYERPGASEGNVAITSNGGRTWRPQRGVPPHGYRSAVTFWAARKAWVAVGISGSDVSFDNGDNWQTFYNHNLNSVGVGSGIVAVGPKGTVATIPERYTQR